VATSLATLRELVSPWGEAEFRSALQRRELTFSRGHDPHSYVRLLNWDMLLSLLERGEHPRGLEEFRLVKESVRVPAAHWLTRSPVDGTNKVDTAKLEQLMGQGFSLVIDNIDRHVPQLTELCNDIKRQNFERSRVAVVVSTGTGGALKIHYDPEDLVILQVEGTKRWQIFGPPARNPVPGTPREPAPPEDSPIFDEILEAGDLLFLPAGNWHHCQNGPGRSLHLGIFFIAPTTVDLLREMTLKLVEEEIFRTPLSRLENPTLANLEDDVKRRLIDRVNRMDLRDFVSKWIAH
jgi:ribosomal protein L16 Arg81 hydroxylase